MKSFSILMPFVAAATTLPSFCAAAATPSYPACDTTVGAHSYTNKGTGFTWWRSDDKVEYLAPGLGSCNEKYTDTSAVVCVAPGWTSSAHVNACDNWVQVVNDKTGHAVFARVLDTCGAVSGTTFGCNDIYLSKEVFTELAGDNSKKALDDGHLDTTVSWGFIKEPCEACAQGLPGKDLTGAVDTCKGNEPFGYLRCGRLTGKDVITDPAKLKQYCYKSKSSCSEHH